MLLIAAPGAVAETLSTTSFNAPLVDGLLVDSEISSALDDNLKTHIAWVETIEGENFLTKEKTFARRLMYSVVSGDLSTTTEVYNPGGRTKIVSPNIALDSSGNPHIVFAMLRDTDVSIHRTGNNAVMYAGGTGGGFEVSQVSTNVADPESRVETEFDAATMSVIRPEITLEGDTVVIGYFTGSVISDQRYVRATKSGSSWDRKVIFDGMPEGGPGNAYGLAMSYPSRGTLKYAYGDESPFFYPDGDTPQPTKIEFTTSGTKEIFRHLNVRLTDATLGVTYMSWFGRSTDLFAVKALPAGEVRTFAMRQTPGGHHKLSTINPSNGKFVGFYRRSWSNKSYLMIEEEAGSHREIEIEDIGVVMGKRALNVVNGFVSIVTASDKKDIIYVTTFEPDGVTPPGGVGGISDRRYYRGLSDASGGPSWFVVEIDSAGTGKLLEFGSSVLSFTVDSSGAFSFNAGIDSYSDDGQWLETLPGVFTGQVTDSQEVIDATVDGSAAGTFTANRQLNAGDGSEFTGFYQGSLSEAGQSATARAVIFPDGSLYFNSGDPENDDVTYGEGTIQSSGAFSGSDNSGDSFSGTVALTETGILSGSTGSVTFELTAVNGRLAGSDSDNDGVPDQTELAIGSDPFVEDASIDTDGDGVANIDESIATTTATQYLMTNSVSANRTSLHIVNSSLGPQRFTGTLYNGDGSLLGNANTPLSDGFTVTKGRLVLEAADVERIFNVPAWSGPAMLEVSGTGEFRMMSKLISPSGLVSNTNCVREERVTNVEGADSDNKTFVRFINTSSTTLRNITGSLYDTNGDPIGSTGNVLISELKPKAAVWLNRDDLSLATGSSWNGEAMLEVIPQEGLKLLNLNLVNGETFFNFSCFGDENEPRVYLQTASTSKNVALTHLINTAESSQQFTGTLYNGDGEQLGEADIALHELDVPPRGRVILSSADLQTTFGVEAWSGPAMLAVKGVGNFELMTKLTSPSGLVSNINCVRRSEVHNLEGSDSKDMSFVRLINIGDRSIQTVTGNLYDLNGNRIGATNALLTSVLEPNAAVWLNRTQLESAFGSSWQGEALLEVGLDAELRLLNLNFPNSETFFNFSCYEGIR